MFKEPIKVNNEFNAILDLIEFHNENLFITGRAGTGKSTLLNILRGSTTKNAVVLAPTGIAALNVGGQTIHSFFKFPPKMIDPMTITKRKNHFFYKKIKLLIIDEISMVRADMLDCIDVFLRVNLDKDLPFGGVQVVFFGDLFQLPPVIASPFERKVIAENYDSPYFFSSNVLENDLNIRMIELHTVYRQSERRFIRLLDAIRTRQFDYDDLEDINQRHVDEKEIEESAITLCATNSKVQKINTQKLAEIQNPVFEYKATSTGQFNLKSGPTDTMLWLKVNAQVLFVKNDTEGRYVNGTIGTIVHLETNVVKVEIVKAGNPVIIDVEMVEWELLNYAIDPKDENRFLSKVVGTFKQYPIKLAWAMTIHKSQGKTFDNVIIDLGRGAFDHGQTYVALSRCRTFNGIMLKQKLKASDILVDPIVVDYYENMIRS